MNKHMSELNFRRARRFKVGSLIRQDLETERKSEPKKAGIIGKPKE